MKLVVTCMSDELKRFLQSRGVKLPRIPTCPAGKTIGIEEKGIKRKPSKYNEFMSLCIKRKRAESPGRPITVLFRECAEEYKRQKG